jgi:hypothetical protein
LEMRPGALLLITALLCCAGPCARGHQTMLGERYGRRHMALPNDLGGKHDRLRVKVLQANSTGPAYSHVLFVRHAAHTRNHTASPPKDDVISGLYAMMQNALDPLYQFLKDLTQTANGAPDGSREARKPTGIPNFLY